MILKPADDKKTTLEKLESMLETPGLSAKTRAAIDREIRTTRAGISGEADAAYHIDFHFRNSENTAVLHDLRLELGDGRVAQIDHLIIHLTNKIWLLETKRVAHGVKITDEGEFLRWNGHAYEGMASPIEQNKRHTAVLKEVIRDLDVPPVDEYVPYVLLSPKSRVDRPAKFDTSSVVVALDP